jgi:hypothetical protein
MVTGFEALSAAISAQMLPTSFLLSSFLDLKSILIDSYKGAFQAFSGSL